MSDERNAVFRGRAGLRRKVGKSTLGLSTEDVRRSARNVRARGRAKAVRSDDVVADVLATRLARFVKQGRVRVPVVDVPALSRRADRVLAEEAEPADGGLAVMTKLTATLREAAVFASRRTVRQHPSGSIHDDVQAGLPVVTVGVLSHEEEDVRSAAQNVYDRGGRIGELPTAEVVAEMIAARLAVQPSVVGIAIDAFELKEYCSQIEKMLASVRPESPWRSALGPVYRSDQVMVMLSGLSAAELATARRRRSLLGLRTSDNQVVYPAFQFEAGQAIPKLEQVLQAFPRDEDLAWDIASWLTVPLVMLEHRSIIDVLKQGDIEAAERAARTVADRWGE